MTTNRTNLTNKWVTDLVVSRQAAKGIGCIVHETFVIHILLDHVKNHLKIIKTMTTNNMIFKIK